MLHGERGSSIGRCLNAEDEALQFVLHVDDEFRIGQEVVDVGEDEVVLRHGGRCWLMCISSGVDDVTAPSGAMVCVDAAVFCEEEHRGCWSMEAFGEEVPVCRSFADDERA